MNTTAKLAEESTMNDTLPPLPESVTAAIEVFAVACRFDKGDAARIAAGRTLCDAISEALAAHDAEQALPRKERPDFMAGYVAGLADGRRCAERDSAEQAAKAVPAGFKLVPVEPTLEMLTAAGKEDDRAFIDGMPHGATAADTWAAMLAAAPTPPAPEAQQALASDWSWTTVRMELEASGRDDLSAWVSQQIEPKAHAGEPVVPYLYVYEYDSPFGLNREFYPSGWNGQKPTRTVPLYTTPQPAQAERVGLTDEQIAEGRYRTWAAEPEDAPEAWSFLRGARWAEKHFGIGATTGKEPGNV